jgi:hypothetical protein
VAKVRPPPKPAPRKKGRPRRGEVREPNPETRLQRQVGQAAPEALAELTAHCDVGTKKNSQGYKETWRGYKLHADVSDQSGVNGFAGGGRLNQSGRQDKSRTWGYLNSQGASMIHDMRALGIGV